MGNWLRGFLSRDRGVYTFCIAWLPLAPILKKDTIITVQTTASFRIWIDTGIILWYSALDERSIMRDGHCTA